jgi:CBS domain-containing protein
MLAREIMTKDPEVIDGSDTIANAAKRLAHLNVGAMPICKGNDLRGMLTDRDIVAKVVATGRNPPTTQAKDLEQGDPVTIGADDPIEKAMQTMIDHKVRRLPVIDGTKLVGMVSQADLAKALPKEKTGEMVAAISS